MATVKVSKAGKRILKAIGMDDIKKLLDACEIERDEAIILFMLDTGCRGTELISLNCGDIDTKTGAVQYSPEHRAAPTERLRKINATKNAILV